MLRGIERRNRRGSRALRGAALVVTGAGMALGGAMGVAPESASAASPASWAYSAYSASPAAVAGPAAGAPAAHAPAAQVPAVAAAPAPWTNLASYMVVDADTGVILADKAPHAPYAPASTIKTLTAVTLMPRLDPDSTVVPAAADFQAEPDGSAVGMAAGVPYAVSDLWHAVFLVSGNDAIAELSHLAGGRSRTLSLMRGKARALGAYDTVVGDADGYDVPGQVTSAYDLALFARAGMANGQFRADWSLRSATFPEPGGRTTTLKSEDPMLLHYAGMVGGKGGITTIAGHTYVGVATRGGHTLIVTGMHGDTDIWDQVTRLLDWGFAEDGKVSGVGHLRPAAPPTTPAPTTMPTKTPSPTPSATAASIPATATATAMSSSGPGPLASPTAVAAADVAAGGPAGGSAGNSTAMWSVGAVVVLAGVAALVAGRRRVEPVSAPEAGGGDAALVGEESAGEPGAEGEADSEAQAELGPEPEPEPEPEIEPEPELGSEAVSRPEAEFDAALAAEPELGPAVVSRLEPESEPALEAAESESEPELEDEPEPEDGRESAAEPETAPNEAADTSVAEAEAPADPPADPELSPRKPPAPTPTQTEPAASPDLRQPPEPGTPSPTD